MAAKYPADSERLEDIYQDEIILEFSSILDFRKFARSKDGLCLDETDIQQIAEENPDSVVGQKMQMLRKWGEKTGAEATAHKIRSVVKRFRDPESEEVNAILFNSDLTKHLHFYKPSTKQFDQMQRIVKRLDDRVFTFVALGKHTYALRQQKMYRLKYSDLKAKWDQVKGTNENHGIRPPAIALNGSIYVCGTGDYSITSSSVEMYNTDSDIWTIIPGITIARMCPCVVAANDCIYCIGGEDEKGNELRTVQRLEVETGTETEVDPIPRPIQWSATAVEKDEILYVADRDGIECYDLQKNSWNTMETDQWSQNYILRAHIHFVDDQLYAVFNLKYRGVEIYKLNQTTGEMTLLAKREDLDMDFINSVAVKL